MPTPIRIKFEDIELTGYLNDSESARHIARRLPQRFLGNYWGDEIYGTVGITLEEAEDARLVIEEPGTLAYWPLGKAFCIFWGPTPVSEYKEIRAVSPVNVVGKIDSGLELLISKPGETPIVTVEEIE